MICQSAFFADQHVIDIFHSGVSCLQYACACYEMMIRIADLGDVTDQLQYISCATSINAKLSACTQLP